MAVSVPRYAMARLMRHVARVTPFPSLLSCAVLMTAISAAPVAQRLVVRHSDARPAEEGLATLYARRRAGRRTASGERYDPRALVAAHPTLAFGTQVRVTRLETG